jgi:hypothetical protein
MFVIFGLTRGMDYKVSYGLSSGFTLFLGIFLLITIKNANIEKKAVKNLPLK